MTNGQRPAATEWSWPTTAPTTAADAPAKKRLTRGPRVSDGVTSHRSAWHSRGCKRIRTDLAGTAQSGSRHIGLPQRSPAKGRHSIDLPEQFRPAGGHDAAAAVPISTRVGAGAARGPLRDRRNQAALIRDVWQVWARARIDDAPRTLAAAQDAVFQRYLPMARILANTPELPCGRRAGRRNRTGPGGVGLASTGQRRIRGVRPRRDRLAVAPSVRRRLRRRTLTGPR